MSSFKVRWAGWSPSWLVPVKATDVSKSKLILPSGFGYSIGLHSLAGFSLLWSGSNTAYCYWKPIKNKIYIYLRVSRSKVLCRQEQRKIHHKPSLHTVLKECESSVLYFGRLLTLYESSYFEIYPRNWMVETLRFSVFLRVLFRRRFPRPTYRFSWRCEFLQYVLLLMYVFNLKLPLILGKLISPAAHPTKHPPGNVSLGMLWKPPSTKARAP